MLIEIYIEALLVDEKLADQEGEAWDAGVVNDQVAWLAWWLMIGVCFRPKADISRCTNKLQFENYLPG